MEPIRSQFRDGALRRFHLVVNPNAAFLLVVLHPSARKRQRKRSPSALVREPLQPRLHPPDVRAIVGERVIRKTHPPGTVGLEQFPCAVLTLAAFRDQTRDLIIVGQLPTTDDDIRGLHRGLQLLSRRDLGLQVLHGFRVFRPDNGGYL